MAVPASYLTSSVFNTFGRWSTYGPPTDVKVLKDESNGQVRYLEVVFSVLSQSGPESVRRGVIAAVQPKGSETADAQVIAAAQDVAGPAQVFERREGKLVGDKLVLDVTNAGGGLISNIEILGEQFERADGEVADLFLLGTHRTLELQFDGDGNQLDLRDAPLERADHPVGPREARAVRRPLIPGRPCRLVVLWRQPAAWRAARRAAR